MVRFSESIEAITHGAELGDIPLDPRTAIVRDGAGRLILARERVEDVKHADRALRDSLNGYAGAIVLVTGGPAKRLLDDPTAVDISLFDSHGIAHRVKFIDRRVVGMDWLRAPAPPSSGPTRLVFGSLKGGVGRSTALAVLAADLARNGKRVLAIDLDLEAPGIGSMLLPASEEPAFDRRPRFGVVNYLVENGLGGVADDELYDFIGVSPFEEGSIDVIPAVGRDIDDRPELMMAMLPRALVEDREAERTISVTDQLNAMVDRFAARAAYDAILIDARAGMSEITAAPLLGLGAEMLFFGVDQPQTFRGYSYILSHLVSISDFSRMSEETDWRARLTFVQAKAPAAPSKRAPFLSRLYELCAEYLYDIEQLDETGSVVPEVFNPMPHEEGPGVPHDAAHIQFHPDYEAFDPIGDKTQLDPEVYGGPFGPFLKRAWGLLGLNRLDRP